MTGWMDFAGLTALQSIDPTNLGTTRRKRVKAVNLERFSYERVNIEYVRITMK